MQYRTSTEGKKKPKNLIEPKNWTEPKIIMRCYFKGHLKIFKRNIYVFNKKHIFRICF